VSPVEAQKTEKDRQEPPAEGCAAVAMRVLRMLGATDSKREETARRAANEIGD
jgi:hypothetical protein